jgi:hypothetical protein
MGRPSDYTPEIAKRICDRLAMDESLLAICRDEDMPSAVTVYNWRRNHPEFFSAYACAREDAAHTSADSVKEVRERVLAGEIAPDVARVVIDSIKWETARRAPKDFGDKVDVNHGGNVGLTLNILQDDASL